MPVQRLPVRQRTCEDEGVHDGAAEEQPVLDVDVEDYMWKEPSDASRTMAPSKKPLWAEEFSVHGAEDKYVLRRQFTKFLVLTSFGMFAGNVWIWAKSLFAHGHDEHLSGAAGREGLGDSRPAA